MRSNEALYNICEEIYREMYSNAEPAANWDELVKSGETKQDNFFMNYYISEKKHREIVERICARYPLTRRDTDKIEFTVSLGCSPSWTRKEWDAEANRI